MDAWYCSHDAHDWYPHQQWCQPPLQVAIGIWLLSSSWWGSSDERKREIDFCETPCRCRRPHRPTSKEASQIMYDIEPVMPKDLLWGPLRRCRELPINSVHMVVMPIFYGDDAHMHKGGAPHRVRGAPPAGLRRGQDWTQDVCPNSMSFRSRSFKKRLQE